MNADETAEQKEAPTTGRHARPDGVPPHPAIDLSRDPNPGTPDHAKPDDK
ncbi:MAG TPA: hypothetical protein VJT49_03000 [Amycolatopsis sp.]|nr:hypothetical protein [Amycolatopsis sp.]HKS44083.1 hypothetical protein [Amycolatopsis sp.]